MHWKRKWQPTPGKNTGVGCHFLLQCMKVKSESEVAQSCPTLSNPMDCSLSGSSVHGIFQARKNFLTIRILGNSHWHYFCHDQQILTNSLMQYAVINKECQDFRDRQNIKLFAGWHPSPGLLPGKSHGQRSLVGCSQWGHKESDTTERLHFHFSLSCIGKGNGNQIGRASCRERV